MNVSARTARTQRLRIIHLFPDVLRTYGDGGNVMALARRAEARSIVTSVVQVRVGAARIPAGDLVFIGGGQDREQVTVAIELERLGGQLWDLVAGGAALLAVCGGYQNLGSRYRTPRGVELAVPGLLPVSTDAQDAPGRLVGPVVAEINAAFPRFDGAGPVGPDRHLSVVGFENHGGRTFLDPGARSFATVEIGHGNNDLDATEGVLVLPDEGGLRGLRVGTYLHGPLLPRNPHIADALIGSALGRGVQPFGLARLDDRLEWRAHDLARDRLREDTRRETRIPGWAHHAFDPVRSLIGF